jgi:hypothetical protein
MQNKPNSEGETCETNPIRRQVVEGKEVMVNWSDGLGSQKQSQRAPRRSGRPSPGPLALTLPPITPASASNKANFPRLAGRAAPRANHAKQTQCGGPIVRNEPNSRPAEFPGTPDCAKRTQFGPPPRGCGGRNVRNKPNLGRAGTRHDFHYSNPMSIVRNEANFRRAHGNGRRQAGSGGSRGGPNAQDEANSHWPAPSRDIPLFQYSIIPVFHPPRVPSFPSTWTRRADCVNNGGLDRLRSFPGAR